MLQGEIQVTSFDMDRLFSMIEQLRKNDFPEAGNLSRLEDELARSEEVASEQVGADVVTMNSRVLLRDEANGHEMHCTLVFPPPMRTLRPTAFLWRRRWAPPSWDTGSATWSTGQCWEACASTGY